MGTTPVQKRRLLSALILAQFLYLWTKPIDLAGHFVVARQRREDVEACGGRRRRCRSAYRFAQIEEKARLRTGRWFPVVTIQEAGLDGFWIHRVLEANGIESHVVDAASIATSRRRRRAKTDKIDGEALVRALLAYKRGEPRVCAMVKAPSPEDEDRRRICRERKVLIAERVRHVNRIKGLLFAHGVSGYQPLRKDRRKRLRNSRPDMGAGCRRISGLK